MSKKSDVSKFDSDSTMHTVQEIQHVSDDVKGAEVGPDADKMANQSDPSRTSLLILGMHRSGTSALTRVLSLLGAALPKDIMKPQTDNEAGFWEPVRLVSFHDRVLAEAKSAWNDWRPLDLTLIPSQRRQEIEAETISLIRSEYADEPLIVVKDPRICRFVPSFVRALATDGIATRAILLFRNPLEVAHSLEGRNNLLSAEAGLLWLRHVLDAEVTTRQLPRVILSYEDLLNDWKQTIERITENLQITWPYGIEDIGKQVEEYLAPEHRHYVNSTEEVLMDPAMRSWIAEAYCALKVLGTNPSSEQAFKELDRIRLEFDHATPAIAQYVAQLRSAAENEKTSLGSTLAERETELSDIRKQVESLEAELAERTMALSKTQHKVQTLEAGLAERGAMLSKTEQKAEALETGLAEDEAALNETRQIVAILESRLAEREVALSEALHRATILDTEFSTAREQLAQTQADLTTEREQHRNTMATLAALREQRETEIAGIRSQLAFTQQMCRAYTQSTSWKLTAPIRAAKRAPKALVRALRSAPVAIRIGGGLLPTVRKAVKIWRREGTAGLAYRLAHAESMRSSGVSFGHRSIPTIAPLEMERPQTSKQNSAHPVDRPQALLPAEQQTRRIVKQNARLWYYVGDTLDWLKVHAHVTGVGRVSTELLFAALQGERDVSPCIFGESQSSLLPVTGIDLEHISTATFKGQTFPSAAFSGAETAGPEAGDHVFFTGLVWTPNFTELFRRLNHLGIGFSVLVHDIIPLEASEFFDPSQSGPFGEWLSTTLQLADLVFVSSNVVKDKILRWALLNGVELRCDIRPIDFGSTFMSDISVVPEITADPRLAAVRADNFVLSVGTIDKRKNQIFLCRMWESLAKSGRVDKLPQLVLVGRDDVELGGKKSPFADLIKAGHLLVLEGLRDEQVIALMRSCRFSAFSSLSEGYGLPVEESLQCGKLCLCTDLAEIKEFAGDLPWYFSVNDSEAAQEVFLRAILDDAALADAEAKIASQFKLRSWRTAFANMESMALEATKHQPRPVEYSSCRPEFPGAQQQDISVAMASAARWCTENEPEVSIVIVNWNSTLLTLECVRQVWSNTEGHTYEIVIVDNGSIEREIGRLASLPRGVRLLSVGCNRFFGEANNIGVEAARGKYVFLLNNDAFPKNGWLAPLIGAIKNNPEVGAAGPLFLYPNGKVQEAGAIVNEGGYPIRLGRGDERPTSETLQEKFTDYISAAALLLDRTLFLQVGGFDLSYEPAYYEDTDLCFKLRAMGKKVLYCPTSQVVHIEGFAANGDPGAEAYRKALGDINRDKFVARWGGYLQARTDAAAAAVKPAFIPTRWSSPERSDMDDRPEAALYTPYALTPGGGERYILSIARQLSKTHRVKLVTPHSYSNLRMRNLACELDIDLSMLQLVTEAEFLNGPEPDIMVTMGNSVLPRIYGRGRLNFYMCQFPFLYKEAQDSNADLLASYDAVIVNSTYTQRHYLTSLNKHGMFPLDIHVVFPPVPLIDAKHCPKERMILSVGRFFVGGHSKRHDLLIEAFKKMIKRGVGPVELCIAGSSTPDPHNISYLASLKAAAEGFPVKIYVNPSNDQLHDLYRRAMFYWHGTGLGSDLDANPAQAEHFGISVVEAMSAGAVPFAFDAGGPCEIIRDGESGFLYKTQKSLIEKTARLLSPTAAEELERVKAAAQLRANDFALDHFNDRVSEVIRMVGRTASNPKQGGIHSDGQTPVESLL